MDMAWFGMASSIIESGSYYVEGGQKNFIRAGAEGVMLNITEVGGVLSIVGTNIPLQDTSQPMWATSATPGTVNFTNLAPAQ
jgi:hypothetical protein